MEPRGVGVFQVRGDERIQSYYTGRCHAQDNNSFEVQSKKVPSQGKKIILQF